MTVREIEMPLNPMTVVGYEALVQHVNQLLNHLCDCDRHGAEYAERAVLGHIPSDAFDVDTNGMADALIASQLATALLIRNASYPVDLPTEPALVCIGTLVSLSKNSGPPLPYVIVGANEPQYAWPHNKLISTASPLGRALLGKTFGAFVTVRTDSGDNEWKVVSIAKVDRERPEQAELLLESITEAG